MPYNFAAESFHTKKNFVADFLREKPIFIRKMEKNRFWGPLWGLRATYERYHVHLRLIGKLVGDFLLVIIELFSLGAFVLWFCHNTRVWQTDRRTYRRTESPQQYLAYASQLHGKNVTVRPVIQEVCSAWLKFNLDDVVIVRDSRVKARRARTVLHLRRLRIQAVSSAPPCLRLCKRRTLLTINIAHFLLWLEIFVVIGTDVCTKNKYCFVLVDLIFCSPFVISNYQWITNVYSILVTSNTSCVVLNIDREFSSNSSLSEE